TSIGHSSNSYEYLMLMEVRAAVILNDCEYQLEEDDALYFDASVPHSYVNREEQTAKIVMLIQYL
ncbi:MAG: cupin domain-containing protein, partial [Eisenbergiella sp.]